MESPTNTGEKALEPPRREVRSLFVRNLFWLIALGVMVTAWIIKYTDWFSEFAGLLALGGLFSWLAFVAKILPEDRVKDLQAWVDPPGTGRSGQTSRIAADDDNLFRYLYCSRAETHEFGSVSP